ADVIALEGTDASELLTRAGSVEHASEHPIAQAIAAHAQDTLGDLPAVIDFQNTPGLGVHGSVDDVLVHAGRPQFLTDAGLAITPAAETTLAEAQASGRTAITVGWEGQIRGIITLADAIKDTSTEAITALKDLGITPVLLTGDA